MSDGYDVGMTRKRSLERRKLLDLGETFPTSGLSAFDGRTVPARRIRGRYDRIADDLGGVVLMSESQRIIVERASCLAERCLQMEKAFLDDEAVDIAKYCYAVNSLASLLQRLGLRKQMKVVDLGDYLKIKYNVDVDNDLPD